MLVEYNLEFKKLVWTNYYEANSDSDEVFKNLCQLVQVCVRNNNFLLLDNIFFIILSVLLKKNDENISIDELIQLFKDYEYNILFLVEIKKWAEILKQFYDNINQKNIFLLAAKHAGAEVFDILDTYGLIEHQVDENENSALHIAALNNNSKFIEHFMIRIGVNSLIEDIKSLLIENNLTPTDDKIQNLKFNLKNSLKDRQFLEFLSDYLKLDSSLVQIITKKRQNFHKLKSIFKKCFDKKLVDYAIKNLDCFKLVFSFDYNNETEEKELDSIFNDNIAQKCIECANLNTFEYYANKLKEKSIKKNKKYLILSNLLEFEIEGKWFNILKHSLVFYYKHILSLENIKKILKILYNLNDIPIENIYDESLRLSPSIKDSLIGSQDTNKLFNIFQVLIFNKNQDNESLIDFILSEDTYLPVLKHFFEEKKFKEDIILYNKLFKYKDPRNNNVLHLAAHNFSDKYLSNLLKICSNTTLIREMNNEQDTPLDLIISKKEANSSEFAYSNSFVCQIIEPYITKTKIFSSVYQFRLNNETFKALCERKDPDLINILSNNVELDKDVHSSYEFNEYLRIAVESDEQLVAENILEFLKNLKEKFLCHKDSKCDHFLIEHELFCDLIEKKKWWTCVEKILDYYNFLTRQETETNNETKKEVKWNRKKLNKKYCFFCFDYLIQNKNKTQQEEIIAERKSLLNPRPSESKQFVVNENGNLFF